MLGIVEGFYGQTWGWDGRADALGFFASHGLDFYLYAPKADEHLRRRWQDAHDTATTQAVRNFSRQCSDAGLAFGVGLSPLGLHRNWDSGGREDLDYKIDLLRALDIDILAVLFDDMRGDFAQLAELQADIVHLAADLAGVKHVWMCPTYYSHSAILDVLFGERPSEYLSDLGRLLDPAIGVFWTGPQIVSTEYPDEHLRRIAEQLQRPPVLWDNYPVNDGPLMSPHLHLRAPSRPTALLDSARHIAINPMNQAWLSRLPIRAMSRSLRGVGASTEEAVRALLPTPLGEQLLQHIDDFQDRGLDEFTPAEKKQLVETYGVFEHPAAREIVDWLEGRYIVSTEILTDILG